MIEDGYMSIYVWDTDQPEGVLADDFYDRLSEVLKAAGMEWESI